MNFAIRADDISFWTKPEELEKVYMKIWAVGIPISIAVIPFAVRSYNLGDRQRLYQEEAQRPVGDNKTLLDFLTEKIRESRISMLLHGFSHQYKVGKNQGATPILATKENLDLLKNEEEGNQLRWHGE